VEISGTKTTIRLVVVHNVPKLLLLELHSYVINSSQNLTMIEIDTDAKGTDLYKDAEKLAEKLDNYADDIDYLWVDNDSDHIRMILEKKAFVNIPDEFTVQYVQNTVSNTTYVGVSKE
jgi:hypothetical protein